MLFTNNEHGHFAKDPAVAAFAGTCFLYHSIRYPDGRFGIGIAGSRDLEIWETVGNLRMEFISGGFRRSLSFRAARREAGINANRDILMYLRTATGCFCFIREVRMMVRPGICRKRRLALTATGLM